jgi:glycosyltransferase involved in cell wall biosynthesis
MEDKIYWFERKLLISNPELITLLRVRNESLILPDTLSHLASFSDYIVAYDDASTDNTFSLLSSHSKVVAIRRNFHWNNEIDQRLIDETRQRSQILQLAQELNPRWVFCADADERYLGDIRAFISKNSAFDVVRVSLFDAYITLYDQLPFDGTRELVNFRSFFGPERRDIIMLWRNYPDIVYQGIDKREPSHDNRSETTMFYCQHYGKSLSIEHWEETCDYYAKYFPWETYGKKWQDRKGKAVHLKSDFGAALERWGQRLFDCAKRI